MAEVAPTGSGPLPSDAPQAAVAAIFAALTLLVLLGHRVGVTRAVATYLPYLWAFFLFFTLAELVSFALGIWVLAALSFLALREYFTLVDLRIQDRWGMLAAYLAIPFMYYFIQIDWYGMFIISIPVYAFLVIPAVVALGGRDPEGSVLSLGALDLGLILLVYCIGHIGYLAFYSTWTAIVVVVSVAVCDLFAWLLKARDRGPLRRIAYQILAPAPVIALLALAARPWSGVPLGPSIALAVGIPALVAVGCHMIDHLEVDLGIDRTSLRPGRGLVINTVKSFVYVGPVVFHYLRYSLDAY
jgi:phosphatidate cytidylyltransferase